MAGSEGAAGIVCWGGGGGGGGGGLGATVTIFAGVTGGDFVLAGTFSFVLVLLAFDFVSGEGGPPERTIILITTNMAKMTLRIVRYRSRAFSSSCNIRLW